MAGDEFEKTQHHARIGIERLRLAHVDALAVDAEFGVAEARPPVAEGGEEAAVLRLGDLELANGGAMNGAGVAEILAHPGGRVGGAGLLGDGVLRLEVQRIVIAAAGRVKVIAKARQVTEGLLQFGGRRRQAEPMAFGVAQLLQPAKELKIAQAAGGFLDVRLEMIDGIAILGVAFAGEARQVARQRVAIGQHEARQLGGQGRVERAVAGQVTLVEQRNVELGVLVVHLGALLGRAHGMAHAQAGVPELLEESGDGVLALDGLLRGAEQQQQVHVGIGEHLAAAVAAHRYQRRAVGGKRGKQDLGRGGRNGSIDVRRTFGQSGARVASVEKLGRRGTEREAKVRFPHDRRCGCV